MGKLSRRRGIPPRPVSQGFLTDGYMTAPFVSIGSIIRIWFYLHSMMNIRLFSPVLFLHRRGVMAEALYWLSLWNFKKESTISL